MKVTKMRVNNEIPSTDLVLKVELALNKAFKKAGFITDVIVLTRTSMKIGLWMRTFNLDTTKHDRNLQVNPWQSKLTKLPNWNQRVEFNNIVNEVFNKFKVSANIKSGPFTIRKDMECMTEYEWYDQIPHWIHQNQTKGYYIKAVDEQQFLEQRRLTKNAAAREKRALLRSNRGVA